MPPKRKELTLSERVRLLDESKTKSQRTLAKEFAVSLGTVNAIVRAKESIMKRYNSGENKDNKRQYPVTYEAVEEKVTAWFQTARAKNIAITGPLLQAKALEIAKNLDNSNFRASNGWLQRFKQRHNITSRQLCGESAQVSPEIVQDWKTERLPKLCKDYAPNDIFNADETGLCYRRLPTRSLVKKGDNTHNVKLSKERLTVLLCCSQTGEKLKPLVIGKSLKPRCFRNLDQRKLPVSWHANNKAWMTSAIFSDWIQDLNKTMKRQHRQILLLIDNAPTHPPEWNLSNVTVQFFPANTTSKLQPLDQGIIWSFKCHFKSRLVAFLLNNIDREDKSADELSKLINVLHAVTWTKESWKEVTTSTIVNCFRKAGFSTERNVTDTLTIDDDWEPEDNLTLRELMKRAQDARIVDASVEDSVFVEDSMDIHEGSSETWEQDILHAETETTESELEPEPESVLPTTTKEAFLAVETLKKFCAENDMMDSLSMLVSFEFKTQRELLFKMPKSRQTTIDTWFLE